MRLQTPLDTIFLARALLTISEPLGWPFWEGAGPKWKLGSRGHPVGTWGTTSNSESSLWCWPWLGHSHRVLPWTERGPLTSP